MKRIGLSVGVVAVVAVIGAWALLGRGEQAARADEGAERANLAAASVPVLTIGEVSTPQWLEATGTVKAELEAQISAKVMGRVRSVAAREGDAVRRGQLLISLDASDLDASVAQSQAGLRSASVGLDASRVAAQMEEATSDARIAAAQAQVAQSEAAVKAARAKLDLVQAGPRKQERAQASLAVNQARASLALAQANLKRYEQLVAEGAVSRQQYDQAKTQYDVAQAQLETAQQGQSIADEGSRAEDIRAAEEGLQQAQAALAQARAGLKQAQAGAMQVNVRRQEVQVARAQVGQSTAALRLARVTRDFAALSAPFDGLVSARLADPGAMASPGVPLMAVQGGQIRLEAVVPENSLRSVRRGLRVPVLLDALYGREVSGTIVEVAPQGDPSSHTFIVKIGLPAGSPARSGMFGRARFAQGIERRLLVPSTAVIKREGLDYVFAVDKDNKARLRLVTLGEAQGRTVPVLSGLGAGERIVAEGVDRLTDGQPVSAR